MESQAHVAAWSMPTPIHVSSRVFNRKHALLTLVLSFVQCLAALQNPLVDFCRRYGHQSTVIDDKLYIDGGWVDYLDDFPQDHKDHPNTWNSFHDLNNLTQGTVEAWPVLNISLNKDPNVIPTVEGGVLWGDSLNKTFYVFGGATTTGLPGEFHLFGYDIINDRWWDFGAPKTTWLNIPSYGAGVGVSQTGEGYYYGGWISNASMQGWTNPPTMSSSMYKYEYDKNRFTLANSPTDNLARAEGTMVWIPAGDNTGMFVYFGGIYDLGNGTTAAQPMSKILVYDPGSNEWFTQTATGQVPPNRRRHCADVAWAPDQSSYNIYVWGGLGVPPPVTNFTAYSDIYVLTLPSFTWVKLWPDHNTNASYQYGHYSSTCNMVKSQSQMIVIGGKYPDNPDICDLASTYWAEHNLWTGTLNNQGDNNTYWALYNPNVTTNVVPDDVYNLTGGTKNGGATLLTPKSGWDQGNAAGLGSLLTRKPTFTREAPRGPTNTTTPTATPTPPSPHKLSAGAIAGIAIGGAAALILILVAWCLIRMRLRKKLRPQSQMTQLTQGASPYPGYGPSMVSPLSVQEQWAPGPGGNPVPASPPPTELPAEQQRWSNKPQGPEIQPVVGIDQGVRASS